MESKVSKTVLQPKALTSKDVQDLLEVVDQSECRELDLAYGDIAITVRFPDPAEALGEA